MELTASKTASCTIAAYRACVIGGCPFAMAVFTAISFQSGQHRLLPRQTRTVELPSTCIGQKSSSLRHHAFSSLCFLPVLTAFCECDRHSCGRGRSCPY